MKITIPFRPHHKQWEIMTDPHRFKVMVCGRRSGKTFYCVNSLIYYALRCPGKYWYVGNTYKQAKETAWDMLKKAVPEKLVTSTHEQELLMKFVNGSSIKLVGIDNADSLRGSGLMGVVLDEYQDYDKHIFPLVIRPMLSDYKGFALFAGTPHGEGNSLHEEFIRDERFKNTEYRNADGMQILPNSEYASFQFHTIENPFIPQEEIDNAREQMNEDHFRQEYLAEFVSYTGLIYKEFVEKIHCIDIERTSVSKDNIYVGIDTGEHTAIVFCALSRDGVWRVFDEIYAVDALVKDVAKQIKERLAEWNLNPEKCMFIIDSASQHKREYTANGIYVIDCDKDILNQIDVIRGLFKQKKIFYDKSRTINLQSETKSYVWSDRRTGKRGRIPKKERDHCLDAMRYVIGSSYVAKPHGKNVVLNDSADAEAVADKLGILSDEYEKWEDEHQIEYHGNSVKSGMMSIDPVTNY